jgi:hypothetical protein
MCGEADLLEAWRAPRYVEVLVELVGTELISIGKKYSSTS